MIEQTAADDATRKRISIVANYVDRDRLWQRHMEMAEIGGLANHGVNRQALSVEDIAARARLISWAQVRGFEIAVDSMANLFIRRSGLQADAAPVLTGSHMDTQPLGGRFDGIYGVLAGLEVLEALEQTDIQTKRPIELVAWTNEEGSRFTSGAMGSMVFTGARRLEDCLNVQDSNGVLLRDALAETLAATPNAVKRELNFEIAAYVEAHIEQGPRLERAGLQIGVVTGIQGCRWFDVEVLGETAHAGTAPLAHRRDALQAALTIVHALNELMADETDTIRFTVGRFDVLPNSPNSVANYVSFSIDFRHPDAAVLERVGDAIAPTCSAAASRCQVKVTPTFEYAPSGFDPDVIASIEKAAGRLDLNFMKLPSGAFHDAAFLNDRCPTGMIFVPCEKGISHSPAENANPDDLAAGAKVLAATLIDLANR
ncbi:MAG: M20 family metallo-hydrolase [Acidiferrobacterales bacterium]